MDDHTSCPNCGANVEIPEKVLDMARHWQKRLDNEAKNKRERRKTNKKYCQMTKKNK